MEISSSIFQLNRFRKNFNRRLKAGKRTEKMTILAIYQFQFVHLN